MSAEKEERKGEGTERPWGKAEENALNWAT